MSATDRIAVHAAPEEVEGGEGERSFPGNSEKSDIAGNGISYSSTRTSYRPFQPSNNVIEDKLRPIQEVGAGSESIPVGLSVNSSPSENERLLKGSEYDAGKRKSGIFKCYGCCGFSSCGCCFKSCLFVLILMNVLILISLTITETIPRDRSGLTYIYKDTVVLLDTFDPFWYSSLDIHKENDIQKHLMFVYLLECDSVIVDDLNLKLNTTLNVDSNVILLPTDTIFLIEGTQIDIHFSVVNTSSSAQSSTLIISNNKNTLNSFKQNTGIKYNSDFTAPINDTNHLTYTISRTGYYFIGFSPSGPVTVHFEYQISGYKYSKPSNAPSCTLQEESECTITIPTSLLNLYALEYCLFGEVESEPYLTDFIYVDVGYKASRRTLNFISIFLLCFAFLVCAVFTAIVVYWCVCSSKLQRRKSYVNIQ